MIQLRTGVGSRFRPSAPGTPSSADPKGTPVLDFLKLAGLALAVATAGCALATATPPSIEVMDVRLVGIGLTEQQLAVTLCITNPNPDELGFRRITADLDVSGVPLATGASDFSVRLLPLMSTRVPFTVVTTVQNLGPQLLGIIQTGSVNYRVHGAVSLQGAFGITLPYSRSGRLDPIAGGLGLANAVSDPALSPCVVSPRS